MQKCKFWAEQKTGEIYFVSEDDRSALEHEDIEPPEWQKEHLERIKPILENFDPNRYICLPSGFDFHEYRVMEKFISSLSSTKVRESLWHAIKGRSAFRRFKNCIDRFGLTEQWYRYRDAALKQFIIEWCEVEDIPYIDDTTG